MYETTSNREQGTGVIGGLIPKHVTLWPAQPVDNVCFSPVPNSKWCPRRHTEEVAPVCSQSRPRHPSRAASHLHRPLTCSLTTECIRTKEATLTCSFLPPLPPLEPPMGLRSAATLTSKFYTHPTTPCHQGRSPWMMKMKLWQWSIFFQSNLISKT